MSKQRTLDLIYIYIESVLWISFSKEFCFFLGTFPRISLYQSILMGLQVHQQSAWGRGEAENDMARLTALMEELQLEAAVVFLIWEDG